MSKNPKYLKSRKKLMGRLLAVYGLLVALTIFLFSAALMLRQEDYPETVQAMGITAQIVPSETRQAPEASSPPPEVTVSPVPSEATETTQPATQATEPPLLPSMAELYAKNQDIVGWVKIDGTMVDYPVMYTPNDPEKYLHLSFEGHYSFGGEPFIDEKCSVSPRSDNLMIYGHNMNNGSMFHAIVNYDSKTFWQQHPTITYSTLYEQKEYEILAAFYDRVYYSHEDCFKFYQFIDPEDETAFDEGIAYFKEHSLYDTGVTATYGDKLITLVTCAYHVDNGRFVVVAKEKA